MGSENCLEYKNLSHVQNYQCILCSTCESYDVMEKKMNARFGCLLTLFVQGKKIKKNCAKYENWEMNKEKQWS